MTLKTLKDLDKEWLECYGDMLIPRVNGENSLCKDLKQEAIKWIKADKNNKLNLHESFIMSPTVIDWIKNFFNITEEEVRKHKVK